MEPPDFFCGAHLVANSENIISCLFQLPMIESNNYQEFNINSLMNSYDVHIWICVLVLQ